MKISEDFLPQFEVRRATKEAWSAYARRRWPTNCQAMAQREFDLSPGRANGMVWANITQTTIDQILAHPNGGAAVALEVLSLQFGLDVHGLITGVVSQLQQRVEHERARNEAEARRLVALAERARTLASLSRPVRSRVGARSFVEPDDDLRGVAGGDD